MYLEELLPEEVHKLTNLTPEGWPSIIPYFEFYAKSEYCLPLRVASETEVVAVGVSIMHDNHAWLAHIIVLPKYREKGIARYMARHLIARSRDRNCDTFSLIATELGSSLYEKLGFKTTTEYLFFKTIQNHKKHTPSSSVIPFRKEMTLEALAFDKKNSGENRVKTITPHLEKSLVFYNNNQIEGLYMPTFEEGLIIASSPAAGLELLKLRLNTHNNVVFPIDNTVALEYMKQQDHKVDYKARRMLLGKENDVAFSNIYARSGRYLG